MYKKVKSLIFLAIIVAASAVNVVNLPQTASAATANLYLANEMKTADRQIALRNSLALCVNYEVTTILGSTRSMKDGDGRGDEVSASDLASGNWFYDGDSEPKARAGAIVDPDNGTVECRNLFKGRNVAKDLGFGSNIELACAIGLKRIGDNNCKDGDGDRFTAADTNAGKVYDALDKKLGIGNYNNAQLYVLAAATYLSTCGGKAVTNVDDATPDQKANTDKYDTVTVVTGTGATKKVLYTKKNNDKVGFRNLNNGDFDYIEENCDWMVDRMEDFAGDYAKWVKAHPAPEGDNAGPGVEPGDGEEGEEETVTCAVEGIGWIVCPVVTFLALVADGAYEGIETLLVVTPISTDTKSPTFTAWSAMRDFANVAFVGVFLFIIFSQLTSIGLNNYGIKKMLPRLIIAAVLVNVSYWLCAIAVDVSNIVGASLKSVLENAGASINAGEGADSWNGAGGWQGIAGGLMAGAVGAAVLYAAIGALLPALVTAAFAIAMIFIVLSARQALILLWVVISPLAFVAYLLPNTESLFKKWWTLGKTLLLLFAVIALLFGASALASDVILKSVGKDIDFTDGTTLQVILIVLMGGVVRIVPLFVTPLAIKTLSGFAGRVGGFVNNPNKGPFDKGRKRAEAMGNRINNRRQIAATSGGRPGILGSGRRRQASRDAINDSIAAEAKRSQATYIANRAMRSPKFQNQLGGGVNVPGTSAFNASQSATNRALANAINVQASIQADEVKAANAIIQNANLSSAQQQALALGREVTGDNNMALSGLNTALRTAAIQNQMKTGTTSEAEELVISSGKINTGNTQSDTQLRQAIAEGIHAGGHASKANYLGGDMSDRVKAGLIRDGKDLDAAAARRIQSGKLSAEVLKNQDADALKRLSSVANRAQSGEQFDLSKTMGQTNVTNITSQQVVQVKAEAQKVVDDDQLNRQITPQQRTHIDTLRS